MERLSGRMNSIREKFSQGTRFQTKLEDLKSFHWILFNQTFRFLLQESCKTFSGKSAPRQAASTIFKLLNCSPVWTMFTKFMNNLICGFNYLLPFVVTSAKLRLAASPSSTLRIFECKFKTSLNIFKLKLFKLWTKLHRGPCVGFAYQMDMKILFSIW